MARHDDYALDDKMDWRSVAALLAERGEQPVALLDAAGRVLLFNAAMERVLGWPRGEVLGRPWVDAVVPPERALASRRCLRDALTGARSASEYQVVTRDGRELIFDVRLMLVGRRREQGLLAIVQSAREAEPPASGDLDYEVQSTASEFGRLLRVSGLAGVGLKAGGVSRCFEALYERRLPCDDCPILRGGHDGWPRTTVRRRDDASTFEVITADSAGRDHVRVSVRRVDDRALAAIQRARIDTIADRARLSDRERDVLRHLLLGRSLDDIAAALELSRRTVKFHQSNLLQKLGVDSRVDLIRITGF